MIRNGQRSHVHLQKEGKMAYEIDFVGVGDECKKDADAIALRWKDLFGNYKIAVYDGVQIPAHLTTHSAKS